MSETREHDDERVDPSADAVRSSTEDDAADEPEEVENEDISPPDEPEDLA